MSQSSSSYLGGWHFPGFLSWPSDPPWGPCAPVGSRHGVYAPAETDAPYCCIPSHRCSITVNILALLIGFECRLMNKPQQKKKCLGPDLTEARGTRREAMNLHGLVVIGIVFIVWLHVVIALWTGWWWEVMYIQSAVARRKMWFILTFTWES